MKRTFLTYLVFGSFIMAMSTASCVKEGCTDKVATNYNKDARKDDGTCSYINGCTDPVSINYDSAATDDDGSCMTFANFTEWVLTETNRGIDSNMFGAHEGNDSTVTRLIYILYGQSPVDGEYPEGTMIVKHTHNADSSLSVFTAMAKRAPGTFPTSNDWEWFILKSDGTVANDSLDNPLRGADLYDGYCTGCHVGAAVDYVFVNGL